MICVAVSRLTLRVAYVNSLKEKRSIVNSIKAKVMNKFNVSIVEAEQQDNHKSIVFGMAVVSSNKDLAEEILEKITVFIQDNFDIEIVLEEIYTEIY